MFNGLNAVQRIDRSARAQPALVPAVTRALALLDRLAEARQPLPLARLAAGLELPKSSVHGLCATLHALGYLRRHADGSFSLGPRVMNLADAFIAGTDVAQEFAALWADAHEVPDETVVLAILSGADVVYVATRSGRRPLGLSFNIGMRLPAWLAASGKAMLAHLGDGALRTLLDGATPAPAAPNAPDGSIARREGPTFETLCAELAQVRERGYGVDDEGVREGVYCIGAPVFDVRGDAVAGIGMCLQKSPRQAAAREAQRRHVIDVAARLTRRLGGRTQ